MVTSNILALKRACENMDVPFAFVDESSDFAVVKINKPYYFMHSTTPCNTQDVVRVAHDKAYTYTLLYQHISMPNTFAYLDPSYTDFNDSSPYETVDDIVTDIESKLTYPLVVKMNMGSRRRNVYVCRERYDIHQSLEKIYDQNSPNYDYIALAQEYIEKQKEFRVIMLDGKVELVYEKYTFIPSHDSALKLQIEQFLSPIFPILPITFAGIDMAIDSNGKMFVIEINSSPRFGPFIKRHGLDMIIPIYERMITLLRSLPC